MANIKVVSADVFSVQADVIIVPVPARIKKGKVDKALYLQSKEVLNRFKTSKDRYSSFCKDSSEFYKGQIEIYRDADFFSINVQDTSTPVEEVIRRLEEESKLIVILPTKETEVDSESEDVYMSGLRTLQILLLDEEMRSQCKRIAMINFPSLNESIEKVKQLFYSDEDLEIFICDGSN